MMQEGKEELERVGPSPFDIVAAQTPSSPKAPQTEEKPKRTEEMVFDADAPLDGEETREDTPEDD